MRTLSIEKMENVEGGKFWGRETTCTNIVGPNGTMFGWQCSNYYAFWIDMTPGSGCTAISSCPSAN